MSIDEPDKVSLHTNTEESCNKMYDNNSKLNESNVTSKMAPAKTSAADMFAESATRIVEGDNVRQSGIRNMDMRTEGSLIKFRE